MSYAARGAPRRTLTDAELAAVLKASGEHRSGYRDHVIISLAVGTGLREFEIAALDLGDVSPDGRQIYRSFPLRVFKRSREDQRRSPTDIARMQRVRLPDGTYDKLERYVRLLPPPRPLDRPLFTATQGGGGRRLSERRIRSMWRAWQRRAGIARPYAFHELRHTAITLYHERNGDIRATQLFARHWDIETTTIYHHPREETLIAAVRRQPG